MTPTTTEMPEPIQQTGLWKQLSSRSEYTFTIAQIRHVAEKISAKTTESMPDYTDHTVRHMDALWAVADQILTPIEMDAVAPSEAFVLAAAFYVHDLGMAMSGLAQGEKAIRSSEAFQKAHERFKAQFPADADRADRLAIQSITRDQHASLAHKLATEEIPQLGRFLIEDSEIRRKWAYLIGEVAESHHWSLNDVERKLGSNPTPGADGGQLDRTYIACLLRIIDFAHINRDRADVLDRLLRSRIEPTSVVHWDAQENITGPSRFGDHLAFGCTKPLSDVDAWWQYYDTAVLLDAEIKGVYDLLKGRTVSQSRFSLQGVKGAEQPSTFNQLVRLSENIVPLDIRVKTDSMERVVELLGGKQLYGHDQFAPLRELIQNARDSVELRIALDKADGQPIRPGEIAVVMQENRDHSAILKVRDNGVGMSRRVVLRYLLSVGSDFWGSADFFDTYGRALGHAFRPIGKFGIGFLSVFMLGSDVEVETEAANAKRLVLHLRGVGRRGELREIESKGVTGTEIRIRLTPATQQLFKDLVRIVRARAPMLRIPIRVTTSRPDVPTQTEEVVPNWWKDADSEAMFDFVSTWENVAFRGIPEPDEQGYFRLPHLRRTEGHSLDSWPSTPQSLSMKPSG